MKKEIKTGLIILLVLAALVLAGCGTSSGPGGGSGPTAQSVFTNLITFKFLSDMGLTKAQVDPMEGFIRFLLFIVFFLVLYKAAQLLKLGQGSTVVIALVFGLIGMIFVPGSIILAAAASYGTIFSLIILGLPVILCVGMYFFLKDHPWMRTIVMGMLWLILYEMKKHMLTIAAGATAGYVPVINTVNRWIGWVIVAVIIFFIISLVQAITSLSSGHSGSDLDVKGTAQHWWNKMNSQARRNKTSKMNEFIEDQKELELLEKADATKQKAKELVEVIAAAKKIESVGEKKQVVAAVEELKSDLEKAKTEFSKVFSRTRRQQAVNARAIDQLKQVKGEMKNKEKDIQQLQILEKLILDKHKEGAEALGKAISEHAKAAAAGSVIKSIPDTKFLSGKKKVPFTFTDNSNEGKSVKALLAALTAIEGHLKTSEEAQKEVITAMEGAVLEARELMMWKD